MGRKLDNAKVSFMALLVAAGLSLCIAPCAFAAADGDDVTDAVPAATEAAEADGPLELSSKALAFSEQEDGTWISEQIVLADVEGTLSLSSDQDGFSLLSADGVSVESVSPGSAFYVTCDSAANVPSTFELSFDIVGEGTMSKGRLSFAAVVSQTDGDSSDGDGSNDASLTDDGNEKTQDDELPSASEVSSEAQDGAADVDAGSEEQASGDAASTGSTSKTNKSSGNAKSGKSSSSTKSGKSTSAKSSSSSRSSSTSSSSRPSGHSHRSASSSHGGGPGHGRGSSDGSARHGSHADGSLHERDGSKGKSGSRHGKGSSDADLSSDADARSHDDADVVADGDRGSGSTETMNDEGRESPTAQEADAGGQDESVPDATPLAAVSTLVASLGAAGALTFRRF